MIHCLTGELIYLDALGYTAVIDCCGVGYRVMITANTLTKIGASEGQTIRLFTYLQIREDAVELYGFSDTEELAMFRLLITVSGVGPKAAMSILSILTPEGLAVAVGAEDAKAISRAPGVGGKTAARVVLELKDKLAKLYPAHAGIPESAAPAASRAGGNTSKLSDARDALLVLGYSRSEVASALGKCDTSGEVEDMIRDALALLMK